MWLCVLLYDIEPKTARESENFHAGAAAQILFFEPDSTCALHAAPEKQARDARTGEPHVRI